jgi:outer membrane lipoprotein-sorting protein
MMNIFKLTVSALVIFGLSGFISLESSFSQELSLDQVLSDIRSKVEKIESYKADMEMVFKGSDAASTIKGDLSYVKPDKIKMVMGVEGREGASQLMYSDGNEIWQYMPLFNMASKVDLLALKEEFEDAEELLGGQSNMDDVTANMDDVELRGLEELDGERVYVIEGYIKDKDELALEGMGDIERAKVFISSKDGMQRKAEYYNKDGQLLFYQVFKNIEINVDIPDDTFKFTVPEGVNILDTTPQAREMLRKSQLNE